MNMKIFGIHKEGQPTKDQLPDHPSVLKVQLQKRAEVFMKNLILLLKKKGGNNT